MSETKAMDVAAEDAAAPAAAAEPAPLPHVPPIRSRFLFVDVAAQRAKQLRRGALPRLAHLRPDPETGERPEMPPKMERVAMQEVEEGLVVYELPPDPPASDAEDA